MQNSLRKSDGDTGVGSLLKSRQRQQDKDRAVAAARNAGESKFGHALVKDNAHEDRQFARQLDKLKAELRRKQAHIEQRKKQLVHRISQLPEPTILVERAASPQHIHKALYDETYDHYWSDIYTPGYMRNTKSTFRVPNTLPTIDAYVIRPRRKVNVWEDTVHEVPKVMSVYLPRKPLTPEEETDIQRCYSNHLRRPRTVQEIMQRTHSGDGSEHMAHSSALVTVKTKKKQGGPKAPKKKILFARTERTEVVDILTPDSSSERSDGTSSTTFITELPTGTYNKEESKDHSKEMPATITDSKDTKNKFPNGQDVRDEPKSENKCASFPTIRKKSVDPKPVDSRITNPHKVFFIVQDDAMKGGDNANKNNSSTKLQEQYLNGTHTGTNGTVKLYSKLASNQESLTSGSKIDSRQEMPLQSKTQAAAPGNKTKMKDRKNGIGKDDDVDDATLIYEVRTAQMSDEQMVKGPSNSGSKLQSILEMVADGYEES